VTPPPRGKRAPDPAVTDSPATDPPTADPPATSASGTEPPATDRATTEPPATDRATTDPSATNSAASNSPATDRATTEASLVARAQAGDVDAFEQLSGAYADRLFMLLLRLLGDRAEAEDVAQEVMLRAWQGIAGFHGRSSYFTWLYRIAVNEANRALEKRARRPAGVSIGAQELQLPASPADEPSRQVEVGELRLALARALAELPLPLRAAIVLRDVEGLSTQEAAEIAGVSQAAFKSRLHQARLRVRAAIGDEALVTAGG
jgi:RNA polymerase sigma-70 factor (ECF subfamily)